MSGSRVTYPSLRGKLLLAFIAMIFSVLLVVTSLSGGAFGAVVPVLAADLEFDAVSLNITPDLLMAQGSPASECVDATLFNQAVSSSPKVNRKFVNYLGELEKLAASRLAVGRAA